MIYVCRNKFKLPLTATVKDANEKESKDVIFSILGWDDMCFGYVFASECKILNYGSYQV